MRLKRSTILSEAPGPRDGEALNEDQANGRAISNLVSALKDPDENKRQRAAMSLVRVGGESLFELRRAVDQGDTAPLLLGVLGCVGDASDFPRLASIRWCGKANPETWQAVNDAERNLHSRGFSAPGDTFDRSSPSLSVSECQTRLAQDEELQNAIAAVEALFPHVTGGAFDGNEYAVFMPTAAWSMLAATQALSVWKEQAPKDVRLKIEIRGPALAL